MNAIVFDDIKKLILMREFYKLQKCEVTVELIDELILKLLDLIRS